MAQLTIPTSLQTLIDNAEVQTFSSGEKIANPDSFNEHIYFIESGTARQLFKSKENKGILTIAKIKQSSWVGWSNLICGNHCEWVSCTEPISAKKISSKEAFSLFIDDKDVFDYVLQLNHAHIKIQAIQEWISLSNRPPASPDQLIREIAKESEIITEDSWYSNQDNISIAANIAYPKVGTQVYEKSNIANLDSDINVPKLLCIFPSRILDQSGETVDNSFLPHAHSTYKNVSPDAYTLGIRSQENSSLSEQYPQRKGVGKINSQLAILEMIAKSLNVPFKRDQLKKKLLVSHKSKEFLETTTYAKLCTSMGLESRPVEIKTINIRKVKPPFLIFKNNHPLLIFKIEGDYAISGDGKSDLKKSHIRDIFGNAEKIKFVLLGRSASSESDSFNWNWVWSIVKNYRKSLILVVVVSLVAQLFALGVPLLLQQLIDKVLTQGNLSSLNALAGLMIAFALFQSILTALRTFLFVDTTDRIDLTLGSSIIDRLIKLPLSFFEKRPVGELSQRIGEMNNIRSFLTGTAITTFLDLVFSSIYLLVMLTYSPGLTAIALSTLPFYLGITIFVAPIYRQQLRTRAVAQAATQAHLIETLGGIQTVKAQHGELRARWKWQKRYQTFVEQGYKSVILGTTTGQIGGFLNTLSSLLILWFGLGMVLRGEFTLGQLLAFRIFSGYVTAPLLRISNLWQGFQKVNLSMERLADIVNQPTEAGEYDAEQIALPPINGRIKIDNIDFSFGGGKNLQLDSVNFEADQGEFIGVVGLSGSGKSTLMKLISRLYPPNSGRIMIDDIDISKVQLSSLRTQVGIVPQDSVLFEGSVSENIALNDPNIETEDIVRAAKLACAHEFIMDLPQGYATRVAEKGANFSGGQRQRLAIARMLIESPSLLIMDEATSALDADTERKVCRNLREAMSGKTVFFVTHRMATIMGADRVLVMDKGQVAEVGTPQELINKEGIFAALWRQQS